MRLPLVLSLLPFLLTQTTPPAGDPPANDPPAGTPPAADPEPEDVSGLKSALEKERTKRKQYEADLKVARDAQTELDRLKAEARQRDADEAAKRGEWEKLATDRQAEIDRLTAEIAERDRQELRRTVARKHNLPDDALEFVTGEDEAAIEASVKKLAKLAAHREDVDTDSGKPNAGGGGTKKTSVLANWKFAS